MAFAKFAKIFRRPKISLSKSHRTLLFRKIKAAGWFFAFSNHFLRGW